jgi:hypothetical protein
MRSQERVKKMQPFGALYIRKRIEESGLVPFVGAW